MITCVHPSSPLPFPHLFCNRALPSCRHCTEKFLSSLFFIMIMDELCFFNTVSNTMICNVPTPALPRSIAMLIRDLARATLYDSRRMKWFRFDSSTHRLSTACYLDDSFPILKRFFEWATHYTLFTMKAPILPEVQAQDFSPSSSGRFPWCWL